MLKEYVNGVPLQHFAWGVAHAEDLFGFEQSGRALLGPHELGAQTIAPPGIIVREPEESERGTSHQGWRHSIWPAQAGELSLGGVALGSIRWYDDMLLPVSSTQLTLAEVVSFCAVEVPDAIDFVKSAVHKIALNKSAMVRPVRGRIHKNTEQVVQELEALRKQSKELFGPAWVQEHLIFDR